MTHWDFIEEAINLSEVGIEFGGGPFGCVIVKQNKIIARGFNLVSTTTDPTAHAEIVAIRDACKALNSTDLSECILYTSCEPCPMCMAAIYWARIGRVFYSNTSKDAEKMGFEDYQLYNELALSPDRRRIPMVNLGREKAAKVFNQWNQVKNAYPLKSILSASMSK